MFGKLFKAISDIAVHLMETSHLEQATKDVFTVVVDILPPPLAISNDVLLPLLYLCLHTLLEELGKLRRE